MTFAFDIGQTIDRYPEQMFTLMECLRMGGHEVIILSAIGLVPMGAVAEAREILRKTGFNFDHFELITVPEDHTGVNKSVVCRERKVCMLIDDMVYNVERLHFFCPSACALRVTP